MGLQRPRPMSIIIAPTSRRNRVVVCGCRCCRSVSVVGAGRRRGALRRSIRDCAWCVLVNARTYRVVPCTRDVGGFRGHCMNGNACKRRHHGGGGHHGGTPEAKTRCPPGYYTIPMSTFASSLNGRLVLRPRLAMGQIRTHILSQSPDPVR